MNNHNLPAFPIDAKSWQERVGKGLSQSEVDRIASGVSKREYFAAMAMQGILSGIYGGGGDNYLRQLGEWRKHGSPLDNVGTAAARDAIGYADELLKQLETK